MEPDVVPILVAGLATFALAFSVPCLVAVMTKTGRWLPNVRAWSRMDELLRRRRTHPYFEKAADEYPAARPEDVARLALEEACRDHPSDWRSLRTLALLHMDGKRFAAALRAAERFHELKPKELRSSFAVAEVLTTLTWAACSDEELDGIGQANEPKVVFEWAAARKTAQRELVRLGMTPLDAGRQAIQRLGECLTFWPDGDSQNEIWDMITIVLCRFPELATERDGKPWIEGFPELRPPWYYSLLG